MESKSWSAQKGMKFNLKKEQSIYLPDSIKKVKVGLGWDTKADIDASIIMLDDQGEVVDHVNFSKLVSDDNAIKHQGDNLTGEGEGDDEEIFIDLANVNPRIHSIWPVVTVYTSTKNFSHVEGTFCRLVDVSSGKEFCRFDLSDGQS